jgi:hypothetical protein
MFGSFLPEPWFGFGTTKSTQVAGADIVMKSQAHAQKLTASQNVYLADYENSVVMRVHFGTYGLQRFSMLNC